MGILRDVFLVAPAYHHHHHYHQNSSASAAAAVHQINGTEATAAALRVGVIPVAAAPTTQNVEDKIAEIQLWQHNESASSQTQYFNFRTQPRSTTTAVSPMNLMQNGLFGAGPISHSGSSSAVCQDCGNQAKKECRHKRCRTCCKSRGFDCPTHVKSTWIPAARRREKQLMTVGAAPGSSVSTSSGTKKPRLQPQPPQRTATTTSLTSTSNNTLPRSLDTSSSHQDGEFHEGLPRQIRAAAVFKCVKVTALEDGEDEYAYSAAVKIGGRVFKGILYGQGLEPKDKFPDISDLHLGGGNGDRNGDYSNEPIVSLPVLDQPDVCGSGGGGGGFLGNFR